MKSPRPSLIPLSSSSIFCWSALGWSWMRWTTFWPGLCCTWTRRLGSSPLTWNLIELIFLQLFFNFASLIKKIFQPQYASFAQREMGRQKVFPITPIELLVITKYGSLWTKWIYFGWYNCRVARNRFSKIFNQTKISDFMLFMC